MLSATWGVWEVGVLGSRRSTQARQGAGSTQRRTWSGVPGGLAKAEASIAASDSLAPAATRSARLGELAMLLRAARLVRYIYYRTSDQSRRRETISSVRAGRENRSQATPSGISGHRSWDSPCCRSVVDLAGAAVRQRIASGAVKLRGISAAPGLRGDEDKAAKKAPQQSGSPLARQGCG